MGPSVAKRRRDRQRAAGSVELESGGGQRQLRVGEELRHGLAKILPEAETRDPILENASITVTEVRVSSDLRSATAFVMPLAGANAAEILAALKRCSGFLRGLLAREVPLRYTPDLTFALDASFDQAERIHQLLRRPDVARDLQPVPSEHRDDEV